MSKEKCNHKDKKCRVDDCARMPASHGKCKKCGETLRKGVCQYHRYYSET